MEVDERARLDIGLAAVGLCQHVVAYVLIETALETDVGRLAAAAPAVAMEGST